MSGVSNDYMRAAARRDLYGRLGVLLGPETFGGPGTKIDYSRHLGDYCSWGLDNGCFSNAGGFDEARWLDRLQYLYEEIPDAWERCLFAVAPDVYDPAAGRGDPRATLQRSLPVLPKIREIGVPAALVFQDGIERFNHDDLPWEAFDVAFIGGGDRFKLAYPHCWRAGDTTLRYWRGSHDTRSFLELMHRCHAEGKLVHVGRVNTRIRLCYAIAIGAESVDGTLIRRAGVDGLRRLQRWLPEITAHALPARPTA